MATYEMASLVCLIISILLCGIYVIIHSRQHDIHYLAISLLLILMNYSLYAETQANSAESVLDAIILYYATVVFIPPALVRLNSSICKIKRNFFLDINYVAAAVICILIVTTKHTGFFINYLEFDIETGVNILHSGFVMHVYNAYIVINIVLMILLVFISKNRPKISRRCYLYVFSSGLIFFASAILTEVIPGVFDFDCIAAVIMQVILILLSLQIPLYDVESVITESLDKYGKMGIIILDRNKNLLGYDRHVEESIPDLKNYKIDRPLPESFYFYDLVTRLIQKVDESEESPSEIFEYDDNYYKFKMSKLLMKNRFCGYQLTVTDVTTRQKYVKLIESFNAKLEEEVKNQTIRIAEMQDKVILGIAEIVESRDNSTGGHVKRTSRLIEILSTELEKQKRFDVPPLFYTYLTKAAPMHDLGKVAVPDRILQKPGKFTPEEYEQMKEHAAKGGITVAKVLEELNAPDFIKIASNVANYHHERFDGTGYPEKLSGNDIPLEARIMAIADVYDALVSKRCYKDEFDYTKAYNIIMEGMGTQFDPALKEAFVNCVPMFEAYYEEEKE